MTDGTTPPEHQFSPPVPADPAREIVRLSLAGLSGTGDTAVDEAVTQLGHLDAAPLAKHPVILGQVHDRLREVLGELSPDGPGGNQPGGKRPGGDRPGGDRPGGGQRTAGTP